MGVVSIKHQTGQSPYHEILDHTMEDRALVALQLRGSLAKFLEIFDRLGNSFAEQSNLHLFGWLSSDGDFERNLCVEN